MNSELNLFLALVCILGLAQFGSGAAMCFSAIKWPRGLLTITAVSWGIFLGIVTGSMLDTELYITVIWVIIWGVTLPLLTYCLPSVNRFMVGFIVVTKLLYMLTTVMAKEGDIRITTALILPLVIGTIVGLVFAAWADMSIGVLILACSFIGASQVAPAISDIINKAGFMLTGSIGFLFDPVDFLFSVFHIDLVDAWTLLFMLILIPIGCYFQFKKLTAQGISPDTPIIVFESSDPEDNGKIY